MDRQKDFYDYGAAALAFPLSAQAQETLTLYTSQPKQRRAKMNSGRF